MIKNLQRGNVWKTCIISILFYTTAAFYAGEISAGPPAFATGLVISNFKIVSQDEDENILTLQFDIKWDYSWRDSNRNWDAVWIFLKWYSWDDLEWKRVRVFTDSVDRVNPPGCSLGVDGDSDGENDNIEMIVPEDRAGFFIQRSEDSTGFSLDRDNVQIRWVYSNDGLTDDEEALKVALIQVFGIEMVYVPQGYFYIGDGNGALESTKAWHEYKDMTVIDNTAVKITQNQTNITYDGGSTYTVGGFDGKGLFPTPDNADFPTGYRSYYCMKYEISQGQYCDFLNSLTLTQQQNRTHLGLSTLPQPTDPLTTARQSLVYWAMTRTTERRCIKCNLDKSTTCNEPDDGQAIAMNLMSFKDLLAFADWACLRPMSELEFEKAARGMASAVYGEYAWGTTDFTEAVTIVDGGTDYETVSEAGDGLCRIPKTGGYPVAGGPLRCGFAATPYTSRVESGAGCFGCFDMSGNVNEFTVPVMTTAPFSYLVNGDGQLDVNGNADVAGWPSVTADMMIKGGPGITTAEQRLSARNVNNGSYTLNTRDAITGGRLVRSDPFCPSELAQKSYPDA